MPQETNTVGTSRILIVTASLVVLAFLILALATFLKPERPQEPIRLGFAGALTGPASFVGIEIQRGAQIAIEEINVAGGVNGRLLELIARDDEHNPVKTVAIYRELVERQKVVGILGATNSASMLAVTPIVNDELRVPVICPATDATEITENEAMKNGRPNFLFRVGMYGTGQANFMVDTVVRKLGHTKVGLLTWTGGWGVTGREEIIRRLAELGLEPVADETYDNNDTNMTPQLIKLQQAGAESILNYGLVRENTFVARTLDQLGLKIPYLSAWGIAGPAFWDAAGETAEGILVSTTVTIDGPQAEDRQRFVEAYESTFGEPMSAPVFGVGAYDAVYLFKKAIEAQGADPLSIRTALENIDMFDGLIRDFNRPVFTSERHNALTEEDMLLTRWTGGKLLEVQFDPRGPFILHESGERKYLTPTTMDFATSTPP